MKIEGRLNTLIGQINLVKWMLGTLSALNVALMLKLFLK